MSGVRKYVELIESIAKQPLFEGIKLGQKEIEETLNNSSEFQMGIEYEVIIPEGGGILGAEEFISGNNIQYIDEVKPEHDGMTEIITKVMPITTGLKHIEDFFEKAIAHGITFPNTAGLHISISHKQYDRKDINLTKFLVLLSGDYLHSLFPERVYVKNISDRIRELLINSNITSVSEMEALIVTELTDGDSSSSRVKHITAKILDYMDMNGRIELRFFGGQDYHTQFNEIRWQVLRALFILAIAYEHDMYRKEYLKTLYSYTQRKALPSDYDLSRISPSAALELLRQYDDTRLTDIVSTSGQHSYQYAYQVLKGRFPKGEYAIATDNQFSFLYAKNVLGGRFKTGEDTIAKRPHTALKYALYALKDRFATGEANISTDAAISLRYAKEVLNGRFEMGERVMSQMLSDQDKNEYYKLTGITL